MIGGTTRTSPRPSQAVSRASSVAHLPPNWFASVMGTGILAVVVVSLPVELPGAEVIALGFWVLAATMLLVLGAATVAHHRRHPVLAATHRDHPVLAHFYGAVPMALMTVGAGAALVGHRVLGERLALDLSWLLWGIGTVLGLATCVLVPRRLARLGATHPEDAFGGWLMPVVPPMVSAATGVLLVDVVDPGPARIALFWFCAGCVVVAVAASAPVGVQVWRRFRRGTPLAPALVPTWWIVLGPLGQSVTAVHHLAVRAPEVLGVEGGWARLSWVWGIPVLAAACTWLVLAARVTVRTVRRTGLPFGLPWWSFTFPVGTVVTGASALAAQAAGAGTGALDAWLAAGLTGLSVVLAVGLLLGWLAAALGTVRGLCRGDLLRAPASAP